MAKNMNIKKLELRRDVWRLVFDMHMYFHVTSSPKSQHVKYPHKYGEMISGCGDWEYRLRDILERAGEYQFNPNVLNYDSELYTSINTLLKTGTDEEIARIQILEREINWMEMVCGPQRTLSSELIGLYESVQSNPDVSPININMLKFYIANLMGKYASRTANSKEYNFLMTYDCDEAWFLSCFNHYFLDNRVSKELMAYDLSKLIANTVLHVAVLGTQEAYSKLGWAIGKYAQKGVIVSKEDLVLLVNSIRGGNKEGISIMRYLRDYPEFRSLSACEYLDRYFDNLSKMLEGSSKNSGTTQIIKDLNSTYIALANLSENVYDFIDYLASKIVLLDDHLEIASGLSTYMACCEPDYSAYFTNAYFENVERLKKKRSNLVMTLREIKKKKEEK